MSLEECDADDDSAIDALEQYLSVLPEHCEPITPRIIVTDFEGQKKPLVYYDEQNWNSTEDLELVTVQSGWLGAFKFEAAQHIKSKLKHKIFAKNGLKIWSVCDEQRPELRDVVAFDEGILAYFLAAWEYRSQEHVYAKEESIALKNGQLFWIPKWYPLKGNFGSIKFDLVLKHREAEALLEELKESIQSFWRSVESRKWRRKLFFGPGALQMLQLPKHVVCVQLKGIECSSEYLGRHGFLSPRKHVFYPEELKVMDINTLSDREKCILCDVSSVRKGSDVSSVEMDPENEWI